MNKLTPRQQQIVALLLDYGFSNKEIALRLRISDNTVKMHMRHLFTRFAVSSRSKLMVKLHIPFSHAGK